MNVRVILLVVCFFVLNTENSFGQNESQTILFAQCHFSISDVENMMALQENIKSHPNAALVRLDFNTQRAFILTTGINSLTKEEFISWFESYSESITCVQIGVKGVDPIAKYPFENCDN